jgi:hypothetical protein
LKTKRAIIATAKTRPRNRKVDRNNELVAKTTGRKWKGHCWMKITKTAGKDKDIRN